MGFDEKGGLIHDGHGECFGKSEGFGKGKFYRKG